MDRDNLILTHLGLVDRIVFATSRSWPAWVDRDDARQAGVLGLIDAATRFDPERGWKFNTFARYRIAGAITDWLRRDDWASRETRDQIKAGTFPAWVLQPLDHPATSDGLLPAEIVADCAPGPEDVVEWADMVVGMGKALSKLSDSDRHVLTAFYLHGKKLVTIAAELGITESGAHHKRNRALTRLRAIMLAPTT